MIQKVQTQQQYAEMQKPTTESNVTLIEEGNQVKYDGVNVKTEHPTLGDAVYKDNNGVKCAYKHEIFNPDLIPSGYTYEGVFIDYYKDGRWQVFKGNYSSLPTAKYADVVQFSITSITATDITFYLKMAGDYATFVQIDVALTSADINATSASEISDALNLAGNTDNVGYDKHKYWAYLADANGNKVDDNGTQIIVQCDNWFDYRQYQCNDSTHQLAGLTMTFTTWGDMPANDNYRKINGRTTNSRGLMNITGASSYWSTNGRDLSENVDVHSEAGSTNPMKLSEYQSSQYAAAIREYYPTYESYLEGEFGIPTVQQQGAFNLPDGEALTKKYGPMTAPTHDGGTKVKFPALNWAYLQGGHLWDVHEGIIIMKDANLDIINATQTKVGKVTIANNTSRWFAQRCSVNRAWFFNGNGSNLNNYYVDVTFQVGAVTLL